MTWNINMHGANIQSRNFGVNEVNYPKYNDDKNDNDAGLIIKQIIKHKPDVFILVEYNDAFNKKDGEKNEQIIKKLLPEYIAVQNPGQIIKNDDADKNEVEFRLRYGICIGFKKSSFNEKSISIFSYDFEKSFHDKVKEPNYLFVETQLKNEEIPIVFCGIRVQYSYIEDGKMRKCRTTRVNQIVELLNNFFHKYNECYGYAPNLIIGGDLNLEENKVKGSAWQELVEFLGEKEISAFKPKNGYSYVTISKNKKSIDWLLHSKFITPINDKSSYNWDFLNSNDDRESTRSYIDLVPIVSPKHIPDHAIMINEVEIDVDSQSNCDNVQDITG